MNSDSILKLKNYCLDCGVHYRDVTIQCWPDRTIIARDSIGAKFTSVCDQGLFGRQRSVPPSSKESGFRVGLGL